MNLDGFPDLAVITGKQGDTTAQALLFAGVVRAGASYTNQLLPAAGLENGWGMPNIDVGDLTAAGVVAAGAPNAIQGRILLRITSASSSDSSPGAN